MLFLFGACVCITANDKIVHLTIVQFLTVDLLKKSCRSFG